MRIAVFGGTGRIGSQVVAMLGAAGHEAVPHSRSTGADLVTGRGVADAVRGTAVVVNLTNAPSFDEASPAFFRASMDIFLAAARDADVGHAVVLSIVGADRVPGVAHYRAKVLQEDLLKAGPVPYSIVRATQFFEFVDTVLSWTADEHTVRLPATPLQPVAAADVARAVADVSAGAPLGGTLDVAGPEVFPLDELGRITLAARGDERTVVTDPAAGLYAAVPGDALTAGEGALIASTTYRDWLSGVPR
ncbi:SDR family oxidoreductase [Dactylosporangium sp. NPDC050688]|uniref:SDR family oxidoreductase n=1 Tax=Dactylosporangium sp. NPDC050688 TaxID=3157217 RepID=UPI0033CA91C0